MSAMHMPDRFMWLRPIPLLTPLIGVLTLAGATLTFGQAVAAEAEPQPLSWESGDHRLDIGLVSRYRLETWDAHSTETDAFSASRTRATVKYSYRDLLTVFVEFQDVRINGLGSDTSGAGALYRRFAGPGTVPPPSPACSSAVSNCGRSKTSSQRIRQYWAELRSSKGLKLRAGRQDIKLGTEVMYREPNWKYLKIARGSQRLVGTVGWTHGERSNDGAVLGYDLGDSYLYAFAVRPTTGVFDIDDAYDGAFTQSQADIQYGGLTWTAKRDTLIPHTELRLFGLAYRDDRPVADGALLPSGNVNVYTIGFSAIGVHPVPGGNLDLLLWGAFQWGDWYTLSHSGYAALAEVGYQFTELPTKPWLRAGMNLASGDGNATDSDHETFFNMLPTNHLYYGFADRFALGNLINFFAQLKLAPAPKVGLNLFLHQFYLYTHSDGRYFGTGAFNKQLFGIGLDTSGCSIGAGGKLNCHKNMGTELDVIVSYKLHKQIDLQGGYSYLWGHSFFNGMADDNVRFAYLQITAKYP